MCAILGIIDKQETFSIGERREIAKRMLARMEHRGQDSTGIFSDEQVTLGHNRLSIMDSSAKASQPFSNGENSLVLTYNGEIYNHQDLRKETCHLYQTSSDTETLVALWAEKGVEALLLFHGMYALGMYDRPTGSVTLAVDPFAIKPLYYIDTPEWFAWASEVKAFYELPGIQFLLATEQLLEHAVFRSVVGPDTLLQNISRVMPGEYLVYETSTKQLSSIPCKVRGPADGDIETALKRSVAGQLMADVPIGLQLSGGVDSSLLGVFARKYQQGDLHSFSIGLDDPDWNEFKFSRKVAKQLETIHHELRFTQEDFCRALPQATYHLDEPVAYPNTVAMLLLAREATKHVKVLLSGEGADELFGGYRRYMQLLQEPSTEDSVLLSNAFCHPEEANRIFHLDSAASLDTRRKYLKATNLPLLSQLGGYDMRTFLPSLLLRQDKMGMASTVECRFPFLDPAVVALAEALPAQLKCTATETKIALKEIARKYLPEEVVYRKKCGFGLPIRDWLRDEQGLGKYLILLSRPSIERPYLRYDYIRSLIEQHLSKRTDVSEVLWILICLEIWARVFLDESDPNEIWGQLNEGDAK